MERDGAGVTRPERALIALMALFVVIVLGGCASSKMVSVHQPLSVRPPAPQPQTYKDGAIFASANYRPLFEDRRARHVGDTLIVSINENINASKDCRDEDRPRRLGHGIDTDGFRDAVEVAAGTVAQRQFIEQL